MGFKCGIVGLPNVGKSTLFNALTQTAAAQAANYPFCTIEPNVGEVAVPEPRLEQLAKVAGSREIIPARMNFVDIAGLVEGASQGEGLGNKFLANIRETDAIIYVLRCFDNDDVTHVSGKVDPIADFVNQFRADPQAVAERLYVTCGIYESLIYENRSLVPVLQGTGMDVRYVEARDGHNWDNWRDRLREGLSVLFPGPLWLVYE